MSRQIARWSQQYEASKLRSVDAMAWLADWLRANVPAEGQTTIVHGDFRLDNMVLAPDAPRVLSVLDWELSTLGDPLTDVAHFCMPHFLPAGARGIRGLLGHDLAALGVPTAQEILAGYCARRRVAVPTRETFRFYVALGLFRMAAIAAGIDKRREQGNASSSLADDVGSQVEMFADAGRRVAESGE